MSKAADESYEDEYAEYDEFDDEEDEGGLSGFSVLVIGLVMFGAFAAITWIAYQQGIKRGADGRPIDTPYVAADPEPIKIQTADASDPIADREVYDALDGQNDEPVTVISEGPEEPVDRRPEDTIGAIAESAQETVEDVSDAVEDRLAQLAEEDAAALDTEPETGPEPVAATPATPVAATVADASPPPPAGPSAVSGTHVVQVGSFRSNEEAVAQWRRMVSRLDTVIGDKTFDIEEADLGDRGVYHRLRVGPFASSDEASAYCASLKENGQDCLTKRI
ncbi:MAG: SPOR domain-containing protein [Pseudomonadota bacterium]